MDWRTPVTLTGKFVRLEPMREAHTPGLTEIGLDNNIWEHMLYGDVRTEEDICNWVRNILAKPDLAFVVIELASGRIAGATRYLNIVQEHRGLEIGGTWFGSEFQHTAANTESKYLLLRYAFETLGCIRVQFKTDVRNLRSQRAIERLGAIREGVLRNHLILPDGRFRDSIFYSILDVEWQGVKGRLEGFLNR